MRRPSIISGLAEEFGIGLRGSGTAYLRSALEGGSYEDADKEAHARSTVWTAASYAILVELVDAVLAADHEGQPGGFEDFKQAVITAVRRLRRMTMRALSYAPPTGTTMPMLARAMYEADERLFPNDPQSRDIAQRVFSQRGLWDESLALTPPGIGLDFRDWASLGAGARSALVAQHADALRIPTGVGVRLLTPQLATAVREADAAKNGVESGAVTEHYLHYAYEVVLDSWMETEDGGQPVGISLFNGGTLVLDEQWNAVLLVTDPPATTEDLGAEDPTLRGLRRAMSRFQAMHTSALQSLRSTKLDGAARTGDRVLFDEPGCPFVVRAVGGGAVRFVRRRCDIAEHLRALGGSAAELSLNGGRLRLKV
jgi:hypothetical protein